MAVAKLIPAVLALGILASLASCSPTATPGIEDAVWTLASYGDLNNQQSAIAATEVTVIFRSASGQVEGYGGCNNYGGSYEINGVRLTVSELISTKIYCTNPPGITEQETGYLEILQAAESFQITGDRLQINSGNGRVLIYTRKG